MQSLIHWKAVGTAAGRGVAVVNFDRRLRQVPNPQAHAERPLTEGEWALRIKSN